MTLLKLAAQLEQIFAPYSPELRFVVVDEAQGEFAVLSQQDGARYSFDFVLGESVLLLNNGERMAGQK
jgi:hypothetical protein